MSEGSPAGSLYTGSLVGRVAKRMSANNDTHNGGAGRKHRLTNVGIRGSNISRRYADVTVSPPDEPEDRAVTLATESSYFVSRAHCRAVDIFIGSAKRSIDGKWGFHVELDSNTQKVQLVLDPKTSDQKVRILEVGIKEVNICWSFDHMLWAILPTKDFAEYLTSTLDLKICDHEILDPDSRHPGARYIVVNLAAATLDDRNKFIVCYNKFRFGDVSMLHRAKIWTDIQAREMLTHCKEAKASLRDKNYEFNNFTPGGLIPVGDDVYNANADGIYSLYCNLMGVGTFEKRDCLVRFNIAQKVILLRPEKHLNFEVPVPADRINFYVYDESKRVLVFFLKHDDGNHYGQQLLGAKGVRGIPPKTSLGYGEVIRVLFKNTEDTKRVPAILPMLKIQRQEVYDTFAEKAFVGQKLDGGSFIETSHNSSVLSGNLSQRPSSKAMVSSLSNQRDIPQTSIVPPPLPRNADGLLPPAGFRPTANIKSEPITKKFQDTSFAAKRKPIRKYSTDFPDSDHHTTSKPIPKKPRQPDSTIMEVDENDAPVREYSHNPVLERYLGRKPLESTTSSHPKKTKTAEEMLRDLPPPFKQGILDDFMDYWEVFSKTLPAEGKSKNELDSDRMPVDSTADALESDCINLCDEDDELEAQTFSLAAEEDPSMVPAGAHEIFNSIHVLPKVVLGNSEIVTRDVYQLAKGQQLGDGVVQFMIEFIRFSLNSLDQESVHIFSYFFFQTYLGAVRGMPVDKLTELPAAILKRLREHTKKVNIFECKYLVIPVLNQQHWYLVVVCSPDLRNPDGSHGQKPCIVIMDSLMSTGSAARHKTTAHLVQLWLEAEFHATFQQNMSYAMKDLPRISLKIPQQVNGVDCGVFMVTALIYLIREKPVFASVIHKSNRFSGKKPVVIDWFPNSPADVEKVRLQMLHCYFAVASWKHFLVYRDDYIPSEVARLEEPLSDDFEQEDAKAPIVISDSPQKDAEPSKQWPSNRPSWRDDIAVVQMRDECGLLSPVEREFYAMCGFLEPSHWSGGVDDIRPTRAQIIARARKQEQEDALAETESTFVFRTAEEIYAEFMAL